MKISAFIKKLQNSFPDNYLINIGLENIKNIDIITSENLEINKLYLLIKNSEIFYPITKHAPTTKKGFKTIINVKNISEKTFLDFIPTVCVDIECIEFDKESKIIPKNYSLTPNKTGNSYFVELNIKNINIILSNII